MALRTPPQTDIDEIDNDYSGPIELTHEEAVAYFDAEVRRDLGISGDEFLRRLDAGEYDAIYDDPEHREIGHLEMLSHLVR
jgi:hypothetical protein